MNPEAKDANLYSMRSSEGINNMKTEHLLMLAAAALVAGLVYGYFITSTATASVATSLGATAV